MSVDELVVDEILREEASFIVLEQAVLREVLFWMKAFMVPSGRSGMVLYALGAA